MEQTTKMKKFWRKYKLYIVLLLILAIPVTLWAVTYKYVYTVGEVTLSQTVGYGGSDTQASTTAYTYTADIDLETNGYYGMWVTIQASATGATDDLVISYFSSYDGTNFDTPGNEYWTVTMGNQISPGSQTTFQMFPAPPHGRIGLKSAGATDAFDYQITYIPARGDGT